MPLYSKKYGRIYPKRKRRTNRRQRRRFIRSQAIRVAKNVHYFTRYHEKSLITGASGTTSTLGVMSFALSDLPGFSEFQNMYDQYKLLGVAVNFVPASNVTLAQSTAFFDQTSFANRIFTVFDYNDKSTPTSVNALREYKTCRWSTNNRVHKRYIRPKVLFTIDEDANTGSSYGVANMPNNPWVSTSSNQTQYFGIKYGIEHPSFGQNIDLYEVECKYYLKFKSPL